MNLAAVVAEWTPPGSATAIPMWGFIPDPGSCPPPPVAWDTGPLQIASANGTLSITVRNCLSEPVSLVIPGQPAILNPQTMDDPQGRTRVTAFTNEAAVGGSATYTWNNLKAGTFLYQSGSNPAKQVQMGLFGALKVGSYAETGREVLVIFSEIDPALHATQSAATPLTYKPKYYLINGQTYEPGQAVPTLPAGNATKPVLVRLINAGLMSHTPLLQGPYMKILAEDGNRYPYPRVQYSALLAAGKTLDALWVPTATGTYALYDRSMSLTTNGAPGGGMLVYLDVAEAPPPFPWLMFTPAITGMGKNP